MLKEFDVSKIKVPIKVKGNKVAFKNIITGIWHIVKPNKDPNDDKRRKRSYMRKFECIKSLELQKFDENGTSLDGETTIIEVGTGWYVDEDSQYYMVAGSDAYRLIQVTKDNHGQWMEIYGDTLEEHFMKID
jgi:hypothetical protein